MSPDLGMAVIPAVLAGADGVCVGREGGREGGKEGRKAIK